MKRDPHILLYIVHQICQIRFHPADFSTLPEADVEKFCMRYEVTDFRSCANVHFGQYKADFDEKVSLGKRIRATEKEPSLITI